MLKRYMNIRESKLIKIYCKEKCGKHFLHCVRNILKCGKMLVGILDKILLIRIMNRHTKNDKNIVMEKRNIPSMFSKFICMGEFKICRKGIGSFYTKNGRIIIIIDQEIETTHFCSGIVNISASNRKKQYVYAPRMKNDPILAKYDISLGMEGYLLVFIDGDLIDVIGIAESGELHKYEIKDFKREDESRELRILQAPIIALYAPNFYVKGLREQGFSCDYMVHTKPNDAAAFLEGDPDYNLECDRWHAKITYGRTVEFMIYALKNYDVFHFHSNTSLLNGGTLWNANGDMAYIKKMKKGIVHNIWGFCDVRCRGEYSLGGISECDVCVNLKPLLCENDLYNKRIERTRKYADCIVGNGRAVVCYPEMIWVDNPEVIEELSFEMKDIPSEFKIAQSDKIKIYHSFANAKYRDDVKGTGYVQEAVNRLISEGYPIEFIYFNNVEHKDIKYYQKQADIIIDQLWCGWYGSTGAECLSMGKIVITHVNPLLKEYLCGKLERDIPVIDADFETIYQVLKDILERYDDYCLEYEKKAREYALKYHDYRVVAKQLAGIYRNVFKRCEC